MAADDSEAKDRFRERLADILPSLVNSVSDADGEWVVKGFIDVARNIYTISVDTKVVSKIMEVILFPMLCHFAKQNNYKMILCSEQNHYPDITFVDQEERKFAVDLKSTYRKGSGQVNGMTLGAFTGYFRNRTSTKNIRFPYADYTGHYVLGVIYSRADSEIDENRVYKLEELTSITSVIKNFQLFIQGKYRIAVDRPGSGNTCNIGSVTGLKALCEGMGPFADLGEAVFDDYWMNYLTKDMARKIDSDPPPYRNLQTYNVWKTR